MKDKFKSNLFKFIVIIIILVLLYFTFTSTFSKYIQVQDSETDTALARWHILLNGDDISENRDFTEKITLNFEDNPHIQDDVIAPTSRATISLDLESTGTSVPFDYFLKVAEGEITNSTYSTNLYSNPWPASNRDYNIYEVTISFTNYDFPLAINSWVRLEDGTYGPPYGNPVLRFTMPDSFSLANSNIWIGGVSQEGNELVIQTQSWAWQYDNVNKCNIFSQRLQLAFRNDYNPDNSGYTNGATFNGNHMVDTDLPDFKIYAYSLNGGEVVNLAPNETTITGRVFPPADLDDQVINNILLYVEWYDGADNFFDNANDVMVAKLADAVGSVNLNLKVAQVDPSTLTP